MTDRDPSIPVAILQGCAVLAIGIAYAACLYIARGFRFPADLPGWRK